MPVTLLDWPRSSWLHDSWQWDDSEMTWSSCAASSLDDGHMQSPCHHKQSCTVHLVVRHHRYLSHYCRAQQKDRNCNICQKWDKGILWVSMLLSNYVQSKKAVSALQTGINHDTNKPYLQNYHAIVRERILYSIRWLILSQCRDLRIGVVWVNFGALKTARERQFWICWSLFNWE